MDSKSKNPSHEDPSIAPPILVKQPYSMAHHVCIQAYQARSSKVCDRTPAPDGMLRPARFFGCFHKLGILFVGVLIISAHFFGVYTLVLEASIPADVIKCLKIRGSRAVRTCPRKGPKFPGSHRSG